MAPHRSLERQLRRSHPGSPPLLGPVAAPIPARSPHSPASPCQPSQSQRPAASGPANPRLPVPALPVPKNAAVPSGPAPRGCSASARSPPPSPSPGRTPGRDGTADLPPALPTAPAGAAAAQARLRRIPKHRRRDWRLRGTRGSRWRRGRLRAAAERAQLTGKGGLRLDGAEKSGLGVAGQDRTCTSGARSSRRERPLCPRQARCLERQPRESRPSSPPIPLRLPQLQRRFHTRRRIALTRRPPPPPPPVIYSLRPAQPRPPVPAPQIPARPFPRTPLAPQAPLLEPLPPTPRLPPLLLGELPDETRTVRHGGPGSSGDVVGRESAAGSGEDAEQQCVSDRLSPRSRFASAGT
ncbi:uncharacterized protein LOC127466560 [Manacus candei]|uniref:uncharacterized protein LOC127466560 n=1 Tax=Manacus candei TaxID=415023 RepID=UPI00222665A9|nr:uncharacterized protein LOC127466560 [Manacus candei]